MPAFASHFVPVSGLAGRNPVQRDNVQPRPRVPSSLTPIIEKVDNSLIAADSIPRLRASLGLAALIRGDL